MDRPRADDRALAAFLEALNATKRTKTGTAALDSLGGQATAPLAGADGKTPANLANVTTLAGYGLGVWWIAGGPAWAALLSILADEADGIIARERGETSSYGAKFDWTADLILTALTLRKLHAPLWTIPAATAGQVYLNEQGYRPPVGSLRALLMLVAVIKEAKQSKP